MLQWWIFLLVVATFPNPVENVPSVVVFFNTFPGTQQWYLEYRNTLRSDACNLVHSVYGWNSAPKVESPEIGYGEYVVFTSECTHFAFNAVDASTGVPHTNTAMLSVDLNNTKYANLIGVTLQDGAATLIAPRPLYDSYEIAYSIRNTFDATCAVTMANSAAQMASNSKWLTRWSLGPSQAAHRVSTCTTQLQIRGDDAWTESHCGYSTENFLRFECGEGDAREVAETSISARNDWCSSSMLAIVSHGIPGNATYPLQLMLISGDPEACTFACSDILHAQTGCAVFAPSAKDTESRAGNRRVAEFLWFLPTLFVLGRLWG
eukprot:gene4276-5263_t